MKTLNKIIFLFIVILNIISSAQTNYENTLSKIEHMLVLNLENQAFETFVEVITNDKYKSIQSDAVFLIAEYSFYKSYFGKNQKDYVKKSFTYYKYYIDNFPNGKHIEKSKKRLNYLRSEHSNSILLGSQLVEYFADRIIVEKKMDFANKILKFNLPEPLTFFFQNESSGHGREIANNYLDDVIINNPQFEVYAYYYKVILMLSYFDHSLLDDGLFNRPTNREIEWKSDGTLSYTIKLINKIEKTISLLDNKYPSSPLTLNLHLIVSKFYMDEKSTWDDSFNKFAHKHLQYILEHDTNKLGIRFLLVKEFVLRNKFSAN